jgi:hypothetical protein
MKIKSLISLILLSIGLTACDLNHLESCEWTLEPEKDNIEKLSKEDIGQGYIPVCARNRMTNKQNCNLKAKLDYSKKVFQKKFKYSDLRIDEASKFPKAVVNISSFCSE